MASFNFNPLATVNPSAAPTPGQSQRASGAAFGAQIGAAAEGLANAQGEQARALSQAGDVANQHLLAFQELNNETAAKDADTQLQTRLRKIGFGDHETPGYFATGGQAAFDGSKDVMDGADKQFQEVMASLPNDAARRMFKTVGQARVNSFSESVATHAAQGRKEWMIGASVARQASAQENAADYFNDDTKIATNIAVAQSEDIAQGELTGASAEAVQLARRKTASNIQTAVIDRKLVADPLGAQAYYNKHMDDVLPEHRAQVEKALQAAVVPVQNANIVAGVFGGRPIPSADAADAVVKSGLPYAAIAMAESGGREFNSDGSRVTSPKGARGSMQVMPGTAVSPGFGVKPSDGTPADDARMGRDYYAAMVARYGDQSLALAAYNAGPGKVDAALAKVGSSPGAMVDTAKVLAMMPAETRAYVDKINTTAPTTPGKLPTSDDIQKDYAGIIARVRATAQAAYGDDKPQQVEQAVTLAEQKMSEIMRGQNLMEKQAIGTVLAKVYGMSPGADGNYVELPMSQRPQTLTDLLKDPATAKAWAQMDDSTRVSIMNRIGKDDIVKSPATMGLSNYLHGLSVTAPEKFMTLNFGDAKYVDRLPKSDLAALMGRQNAMMQKQSNAGATMHVAKALTVAAPILKASGIYYNVAPSTRGFSEEKSKAYNAFVGALSQSVNAYVNEHKKAPSDDDVRKMTGALVADGTQAGSGWFWDTKEHLYDAKDIAKFKPVVPDDEHSKIAAAYQRRYGRAPTDSQVQDAYKTILLARAGGR